MPQHKYLIMAENKSLSFPAAFALPPAPLIDPPQPRSLPFRYGRLCEMDLMNFLSRFIAAIRPSLGGRLCASQSNIFHCHARSEIICRLHG